MQVSIVIVNYNTLWLTKECIQSIKENTTGLRYEIIVVDNDSQDDIFTLKPTFPDVIFIKNDRNLGFAAANNIGLKSASGEYILLLNSDTLILNNPIKIAYDRMVQDPTIGALTVKTWYPDKKMQVVAQKFPSILNNLIVLFRIDKLLSKETKEQFFLDIHFDHNKAKVVDWIFGSFFMFKKQIVVDGFPNSQLQESFFMYAEDMQWCFYFKKLGYRVFFDPGGEIIHYCGASDPGKKNLSKKYFDIMIPNEFVLLKEEKGILWTFFYYFTKGLIHFSFMRKDQAEVGYNYFKYAFKVF
ncbi:glycosyltransferase family 2 protein [soil metagenome]